jgi:hypothetical protein
MTYARLSGVAPLAGFSMLSAAISARAASRLISSTPFGTGSVARTFSCASSTGTPASERVKASRSAGYAGSSGTYAPPALSTARMETIISSPRSRQRPTRTSGPTPRRRR